MSAKVLSLVSARKIKETKDQDKHYETKIHQMTKLELLEEMVRFQEERTSLGHLTPSLMVRGRILFLALEKSAETSELKTLTGTYRRHLEYEFAAYLENTKH